MIIIQNPDKDTYVTDIQTSSNNGMYSNVGQSSTIDLFKIASENKKSKSRGLITFVDSLLPLDGDNFTLTDSFGRIKTFEFDDNAQVTNDNINISIGTDLSETIDNAITEINAVLNFDITAYKLEENSILFKQGTNGESGDTEILTSSANISKKNFVRFEHSAGLLSFDLSKIKEKHLPDINNRQNSVFKDDRKFTAEIKLIDVGYSSTKAKGFSLSLDVLNSSFKEGLGKDVIHFSDIDDANFSVINSEDNTNWSCEGIVSTNDLFRENLSFSFEDCRINTGKENVVFDITDYLHEYFKETPNHDKHDFVVHFKIDDLFDDNTYFVKRLGSRNLKNKQYIPQLILKIDDSEIENIVTEKKRYFDNEELFYLLNVKGNKTTNFIENQDVKLRFSFSGDENQNIFESIQPITGETFYNYKGEEIKGIKKFVVPDSVISQVSSDSVYSAEISRLGYAKVKLEYFYEDINQNETLIKYEDVKFHVSETDQSELSFDDKNIRVSIDLLQKNIKANNSVVSLNISFIDINKQYKSVNMPVQLYSEDLGDIFYEMYDVDSGIPLIEEDSVYTQMQFNGKHYILNLFASENFKNKRVNFKFRYTDPLTGLHRKVQNDNTILRFV